MEKKFRAWNTKLKNWHKTELDFYGFHIFGEVTLITPPSIDDLQYLIIEQVIGFKDIEDNDIYEGDIVIDKYNEKPYTIEAPVIYYQIECGEVDTDTMKVVGNIHKNIIEWDYTPSSFRNFYFSQKDWNQTIISMFNMLSNGIYEKVTIKIPKKFESIIKTLMFYEEDSLELGDRYIVEFIESEDNIIYVGEKMLEIINFKN